MLSVGPLGFPWQTDDPFLFCVHHDDAYPRGNDALGPSEPLTGRRIGMDFVGKDGWRMYHGDVVPGFPEHPHRGFETISIARRGYIDHSDSLGATARFGEGDVQWMTAGRGIVHAEMFPLLKREQPNPFELFQIWLNLPAADKLAEPHFSMLWADSIPKFSAADANGCAIDITIVAGRLGDMAAPPPPPKSWAAHPESEVGIWTIKLAPGARWTLPATSDGSSRTAYFFKGTSLTIAGRRVTSHAAIRLDSSDIVIDNGELPAELLLLQGQPIGEPIVHHGPFVMNTAQEIQQAINDYHRTRYGGWPWPNSAPVHARGRGRFAKHADGTVEHRD